MKEQGLTPPNLPVVSQETADKLASVVKAHRVFRKEQAIGWSGLLGAYTIGEMWFWYQGQEEMGTLVPLFGMPYTISSEAFDAYLQLSSHH